MSEHIKRRGFASMSPERRKEVSQKGGKTAWKKGTAHSFDSTNANQAREKGLVVRRQKTKH